MFSMPGESDLEESFVFGQGRIQIPSFARLLDFVIWNEWFPEVMKWSTNVEKSRRNSFGPGSHFCQQNKHIPLKRMILRTTCKAVNCFSNVARVKYSIVTSHLHLHLLLIHYKNLYRHHTNQLARKVRRLYEGLKLYYDRFSSRNRPGIFHNSANNRESWSRKSDCVTLGKL